VSAAMEPATATSKGWSGAHRPARVRNACNGAAGRVAYESGPSVEAVVSTAVKAAIVQRRTIDKQRGVKAPSEWVVKEAVTWKKRKARKPWIPVPARADPSGTVPAVHVIPARGVDIGFAEVARAETAPPVQIGRLSILLAEFCWLQFSRGSEIQFTTALQVDVPVVCLHQSFAIEYPDGLVGLIEVVQSSLQQFGRYAVLYDADVILFVELVDLDQGLTFIDGNPRVGESGRD